jgi:chromosome segregation ATPase
METKENKLQSLQARLDDIEQRMAQRAGTKTGLQAQLESLRTRLSDVRARQRDKVEADDAASDAGLVVLGQEIDNLYAEVAGTSS